MKHIKLNYFIIISTAGIGIDLNSERDPDRFSVAVLIIQV
jgi:hypothetical protein